MRVAPLCLLILIALPAQARAAPIERPRANITEAEARQFATDLWQFAQSLAAQYVREMEPTDLIIAGLQGIHEATRRPFPRSLEIDIRNTKTQVDTLAVVADARMRIGREPAIEGAKGLFVATQAMPRALDPYCGLVPSSSFDTQSNFMVGYGFDLDGELSISGGVRRNQPVSGFRAPSVQQAPTIPFRIARVFPGSSGQRAGLRPDDVITAVDGKRVSAETALTIWQEVLQAPVDPSSTRQTTFSILRQGASKPIEIRVSKSIYTPESVYGVRRGEDNAWDWWLDRDKRLAYIRIGPIDTKTPSQLEEALAQIRDAEGLILDLRWCPGGFLTPSTEIAGLFMGNGKIASVKYRNPERQGGASEYNAGVGINRVQFRKAPLLLLVNGETSGGGELIACALQDNGRAKVAGQRTLGKGSVQTPITMPVSPEWSFRLTAGTFHRPSGKNLQRFPDSKMEDDWGVRPDKGCELTISAALAQRFKSWHEEFTLRPGKSNEAMALDDPEADSQRDGALRLLRKMIAEKQDPKEHTP